jgi:3-methyladenine DNA glycosylase Tag
MSLIKKPEMTEKKVAANAGLFVQAVAHQRYVTTPEDLEKMKNLHQEGVVKEMGEIAPTHPNARLMRRMQDSNFRKFRRIINLLLKLKRHERKMEALGKRVEKPSPVSRDISENKGVIREESKPLKTLSHSV